VSGGPFLWTRHAVTKVLDVRTPDEGPSRWTAAHDGYAPAVHRRTVELDGDVLKIVDEVLGDSRPAARLAFHLGPAVTVRLEGNVAHLSWPGTSTGSVAPVHTAVMELPSELSWTAHRGELDPPLGWYSAGFGRKEPSTTLVGSGTPGLLATLLHFS
jgi:hypothetical protein